MQIVFLVSPDLAYFFARTEYYNSYLSMLITAFYAFAPQGRIRAVATSLLAEADELLESGKVFSKDFKTRQTYGFQPIILPPKIRHIFEFYVGT